MARLQALSKREKEAFEKPPIFNSVERKKFMRLPVKILDKIDTLEDPANKIAFSLLFGYFRANHKFYAARTFHLQDIEFMATHLRLNYTQKHLNVLSQSLTQYKPFIRDYCEISAWDAEQENRLKRQALLLASKQLCPSTLFRSLIDFSLNQKIEIPKYTPLNKIVREVIRENENRFVEQLKTLITPEQCQLLDEFASPPETSQDKEYQYVRFSMLRHIEQSQKKMKIKKQVEDTQYLGQLYDGLKPLYEQMNLAPKVVEEIATGVRQSQSFQILRKQKYKRYLDLLCFSAYQFFSNQDALVEKLINCTQHAKAEAYKHYQQLIFENKETHIEQTKKVVKHSKDSHQKDFLILQILEDEDLTPLEKIKQVITMLKNKISTHTEEVSEALEELEIRKINRLKEFHYTSLKMVSLALQGKVSGILQTLRFNPDACCPKLFRAIQFFCEKEGELDRKAPLEFLDKEDAKAVFDSAGKFNPSLYKVLLFQAVAHGIKASTLSIKDTLQFKSLEEYLIPKLVWHHDKDGLIKMAGMEAFIDVELVLSEARSEIKALYRSTNVHILSGENKYVKLRPGGGYKVSTPGAAKRKSAKLQDFFPVEKYISVQEVLAAIESQTQYLSDFKHTNPLQQRQKPDKRLFYAGIMGYGRQIGIPKMAYISSGISLGELERITDKYFSLNNLRSANDTVISFMSSLDLAEIFIKDKGKTHTGSDGQKYSVVEESLNASHSFKYFGSGKGSTVYSFVDERHMTYHSEVINSSEREAAWVLDGLMQNEVIKSDIHSTDSHGYTEIIFGATHLLGFGFAPRIKNIDRQQLYTFHETPIKTYQDKGFALVPKKYINEDLIKEHWDEILRFMVTIKLKYATASQLLKRLSSYSKKNPFYKALKNFGQIYKTQFILEFVDDLEFRQAITKQLNKVENIHKFAKAIGKKELPYQTKDEQNISTTCKRLIQNCIVCWNYLHLSNILAKMDESEQIELLELIKVSSIVHWQHINFSGMYDFSSEMALDNSQFDLPKIRAWKPNQEWAEANGL